MNFYSRLILPTCKKRDLSFAQKCARLYMMQLSIVLVLVVLVVIPASYQSRGSFATVLQSLQPQQGINAQTSHFGHNPGTTLVSKISKR